LDGGLLSGARLKRYAHGDAEDLQAQLAECPAAGRMVVTDGVFSMDGDLAPLPALARAAQQANAWLMVDDAHGFGVLGPGGGGAVEHFGLGAVEVPVLMGTLGKAFGTFGAFVAGDRDLIEYLVQRARTYIYTTALPPAVAEATRASLWLVREESWRREKLQALIQRFRTGAGQLGLNLMPSQTPIQPIVIGGNEDALLASQKLLQAGFLVTAIRPPTVPAGTARLRVTLSAVHEEFQVDQLLDALATNLSRTL
jgi:8-amino-7-oxononanoate synthase